MLAQQIDFYFTEECLRSAFVSCFNLLSNELNTEKAYNLIQNCIIHDSKEALEEYLDYQICITVENLKDQIEELFENYNVEIESLFISESQIRERIKIIDRDLEEDQEANDSLRRSISFECKHNSDLETLFMIRYSNKITIQTTDMNESDYLKYEDLDYSDLESYIETYLDESYIIKSYIQNGFEDSDIDLFGVFYKVSTIEDHF